MSMELSGQPKPLLLLTCPVGAFPMGGYHSLEVSEYGGTGVVEQAPVQRAAKGPHQ